MIEITAKEGGYLTQNMEVQTEERIYVSKVYTYDESLWRDATDDEIQAYAAFQLQQNG